MHVRSRILSSVATVLASVAGLACAGEEPLASKTPKNEITPVQQQAVVTVTPQLDSMPVGTTRLLTAQVTDQFGASMNREIAWRSLEPMIASVSSTGAVTAVSPGTSRVVAITGSAADTAVVVVTSIASGLRVNPDAASMTVGGTVQFAAQLGYAVGGNAFQVGWTTSDATVATVDAAGLVTALGAGDATISAVAGGSTADARIKVNERAVASLVLSPANVSIYPGDTQALTVTASSDDGKVLNGRSMAWTSSDENVAQVSAAGVVTAVGKGLAVITASSGGREADALVMVQAIPVSKVAVELPAAKLAVGQTAQASVTLLDASGSPIEDRVIVWQSSHPDVATVDPQGKVTGRAIGSATISAISEGQMGAVPVSVAMPSPTSISMTPSSASITVGKTVQASAQVLDQSGAPLSGRALSWSSSNPGVASVSSSGLITAVGVGSASVRVSADGLSTSAAITVSAVPVESVDVIPDAADLKVGESIQASIIARDADGNRLAGRAAAWTSSAPAVASVDGNGLITGHAAGAAQVTATVDGRQATLGVSVTEVAPPPPPPPPPPAAVAEVLVTLDASSLDVGQATSARVTVRDAQGNVLTGREVEFRSANPTLATVSSTGMVVAVGAGTVAIVATSEGVSGGATLSIATPAPAPVATVSLSLNAGSLTIGETTQSTVTLRDANGVALVGRTIGYTSSNPGVATVSASGLVTAVGAGSATITASSEGKSGSASLTVSALVVPVFSVSVTLNASSLVVGQTTQAIASAKDAAGAALAGRPVSWSSSNTSVATVNASGVVTSVAAGTASIVATVEGKTASAPLTVTVPPPVLTTVKVALADASIAVGATTQATASALDQYGKALTDVSFTWSSSATSTATVSSTGLVTAVASGTATIRATASGLSASATVTVEAPAAPPVQSPTVVAELPREYVQVGPEPAVTGKIIRVAAGQSLQAALDAAQPGDHVLLAPGGVWRGNFVLPAKSGSGWIVVKPDIPASSLPSMGMRMTPSKAAMLRLPRIETANSSAALRTAPGAKQWRLIALEITGVKTSVTEIYNLTMIGDGAGSQDTDAEVPKHIIFDRLYVHGDVASGLQLRRCIGMHGNYDAVIDSWVSECTNKGFDAQAVWGWNSPGPHRITNNYLEASGENVGFGGAIPAYVGLAPADIEIRGNHIAKPIEWKSAGLLIKNLVEFKNGLRVLVEGNLIEGVWASGQMGYAIVLTPGGEGGRCSWCTVRDVTIRRNHIRRAGGGVNLSANPQGEATPAGRITIENNLFDEINVDGYTGTGRLFQLMGSQLFDALVVHNTAVTPTSNGTPVMLAGTGQQRLTVRDNVLVGLYGIFGDAGKMQGVPTLDHHAAGWTYVGNAHVGVSSSYASKYYPTDNFYPSLATVGFTDAAGGDWSLAASSPYKGKATDGTDPGAKVASVRSAAAATVKLP